MRARRKGLGLYGRRLHRVRHERIDGKQIERALSARAITLKELAEQMIRCIVSSNGYRTVIVATSISVEQ